MNYIILTACTFFKVYMRNKRYEAITSSKIYGTVQKCTTRGNSSNFTKSYSKCVLEQDELCCNLGNYQ